MWSYSELISIAKYLSIRLVGLISMGGLYDWTRQHGAGRLPEPWPDDAFYGHHMSSPQ